MKERGRRKSAAGGAPHGGAPWPGAQRSPEFVDFANPGTRKQKENTGRKRGTSRTHPVAFGARRSSGRIRRWRMPAGGSLHEFGGH